MALFAIAALFLSVWLSRKEQYEIMLRRDMTRILQVCEMFEVVEGRLPESIEEIVSKRTPSGRSFEEFRLAEEPRDYWGHRYLYSIVDGTPRLLSLGKDNLPGGEGEDRDLQVSGSHY